MQSNQQRNLWFQLYKRNFHLMQCKLWSLALSFTALLIIIIIISLRTLYRLTRSAFVCLKLILKRRLLVVLRIFPCNIRYCCDVLMMWQICKKIMIIWLVRLFLIVFLFTLFFSFFPLYFILCSCYTSLPEKILSQKNETFDQI